MIFFVTAYDVATAANLALAKSIFAPGHVLLLGASATRSDLEHTLSQHLGPLFCMAHGRPGRVVDQLRSAAIDESNIPLFKGRSILAYSCFTANLLGRKASEAGVIWWGYTGAISAPSDLPSSREILSNLFRSLTSFYHPQSRSNVQTFIAHVKAYCAAANLALDAAGDFDIEAYLCVLHVWSRLRVWLPGEEEPLRHPAAPLPIIID